MSLYASRLNQMERMRALIAEALGRASQKPGESLRAVSLVVYGNVPDTMLYDLFEQAIADTPALGASLKIERAGSRYICWNCCGVRFESASGMCPNCGELGMEVPDEIEFGLKRIETG